MYEQAIKELKAMGVPVMDDTRHGGLFWINAEANNSSEWLSYFSGKKTWSNWTINDRIIEILDKYSLFCEWENPAILIVYNNF